MLLDPGSGCTSPLSIDGVAFGVGTWSNSRFSMVQVGQTVLDCYIAALGLNTSLRWQKGDEVLGLANGVSIITKLLVHLHAKT